MDPERIAGNGGSSVDDGELEISQAALFAIVWNAVAEMLGTAGAAAVVRRAAQRAATEKPELVALVIVRENLEYRYTLPRAWDHQGTRDPAALRVLVRELARLLIELTGTVVVRQLEQIPELRAHGLVFRATAGETT